MTTTPEELLSQSRDALKPCPHCGLLHTLKLTTAQELDDDPEPRVHSDSWAVICDMSRPNGPGGCGASGGFYPSEAEAVSAWNRRAAIDAHLKQPSAPSGEIDEAQLSRLRERGAVAWAGVDAQALREYGLTSAPSGEPAERTLLEQHDREQLPGYRAGYEDGRQRGYTVGHRHGREQAEAYAATQAAPAPQASAPADALALLQQAHEALRYHTEQTRPIANTVGTMALIHDYLTVQAEHAPTVQPLSILAHRLAEELQDRMCSNCKPSSSGESCCMPGARAVLEDCRAAGITATTAKG